MCRNCSFYLWPKFCEYSLGPAKQDWANSPANLLSRLANQSVPGKPCWLLTWGRVIVSFVRNRLIGLIAIPESTFWWFGIYVTHLFSQRLRNLEEPYLRARPCKSQQQVRTDSSSTEPQTTSRYTNMSVTDRLASQSSEATSSGIGRSIYYNSSLPNSQVTFVNCHQTIHRKQ